MSIHENASPALPSPLLCNQSHDFQSIIQPVDGSCLCSIKPISVPTSLWLFPEGWPQTPINFWSLYLAGTWSSHPFEQQIAGFKVASCQFFTQYMQGCRFRHYTLSDQSSWLTADFTGRDNPILPLNPYKLKVYEGVEDGDHDHHYMYKQLYCEKYTRTVRNTLGLLLLSSGLQGLCNFLEGHTE